MIRLSAYKWTAIEKFGQQSLVLGGNILLARLLSPEDFGLIAVLSVVMGLAWNLAESGLSDWLIRDSESSQETYVTVFTYNVIIGLLLYSLIFVLAPFIARLYSTPELTLLSRILGLSILFRAFSIVELTILRKKLQFRDLAIVNISSIAVGITVGYIAARFGLGYWSLVLQSIFNSLIPSIVLIAFFNFRPRLNFFRKEYERMKAFSGNMIISYVANQITQNLSSSMIALVSPLSIVGLFNQSRKMSTVLFGGMNTIVLTTSYPLIASMDDINRRKSAYLWVLSKFILFMGYLGLFIFTVSLPLVSGLFGDLWLEMIPYFDLMVLTSLIQPIMTVNANILKVENRHRAYRNLSLIRNVLSMVSLLIFYRIGVLEVIYGQLFVSLLTSMLFLIFGCRAIGMSEFAQIRLVILNLLPPVILCLVSLYVIGSVMSGLHFVLVVFVLFTSSSFIHYWLIEKFKIRMDDN